MEWTEYLKILMSLLAIVNPIGAVPVFLSVTDGESDSMRRRTSRIASLSVGIVLLVVLFFGQMLLNMFGISIASFRVGGGLLILLMSISMMHGKQPLSKHTREEGEEVNELGSMGVVPLAIPMMAGPGAISTVILHSNNATSYLYYLILMTAILIVTLTVFLVLRVAPKVALLLRKTGINIVTRIMGLIIAAIGVEFITKGLVTLMPGLGQ